MRTNASATSAGVPDSAAPTRRPGEVASRDVPAREDRIGAGRIGGAAGLDAHAIEGIVAGSKAHERMQRDAIDRDRRRSGGYR